MSAATINIQNDTTIQAAINNASDGDTINLASGNYYEHDVTVNKSITIKGPTISINATPTAVVDSQGQGRVFYIPSGYNVTLEYLLIQNGNATTNEVNLNGGGILNNGILNLQNSDVKDNIANDGGGGIANWGTITVSDSNIYNNTAITTNGGGISNWGTMTLNDTNIDYNSILTGSNGGYGGGIDNENILNIFNSNIYNNTALVSGGGLNNNQFDTVNVYNSNIYNNTASIGGGGLYNMQYGYMNIYNSNIYDNSATSGSSSGGGLYNYEGTLSIFNTNINYNTAIYGGGIYNNYGSMIIDNSNIYSNNAILYGGGISNELYGSVTSTITNSNIWNNTAIFGGGIDNYYGNMIINNSNLYNNAANISGGAIYNENSGILTLLDSNIYNNTATSGSAVYNYGSSTINFNRITGIGVLINSRSGSTNAMNNWWGSNSSPSAKVSGSVNVSSWLVLNTNASPNRVLPGGISNITADLTHNQNGVYYDPINGHVPDGIPITFISVLGTLNPTSTITINGVGTSLYTASMLTGTATVYSLVDIQSANTQINVSNPQADVALSQTGNYSGSNVTFVVTATNNGPDTGTNIVINEALPSGFTATPSAGTTYSNGIWTIPSLAYLATATLNISGTATLHSTITNTATRISQTEYNSQPTTISSSVYVPEVDISVNQYLWFSPTSGAFDASNVPAFTVDVRNIGNMDDATNVVIQYIIGNGFTYSACDTRGNGYTTLVKDSNGRVTSILWTIPYMPAGSGSTPGGIAFMNVFLRPTVTGINTASLTNTASLKSVDQYDTNPANNQKSTSITVNPSADIQVNQTITGTHNLNDIVNINLSATNNGPNNSTGVTIKDLLPSGLQWISDNSQGAYNPTTGIWTIGTINNGITDTLTIIAKVTSTDIIRNTAVLTAPLTPNFIDWNYNNNAQTIVLVPSSTTYNPKTNITVNQYLWAVPTSGSFDASNTPTYVVDVRNAGSADQNYDDVTNVIVEYDIADGYQYIGSDTRGNGYTTLITNSNGKVTGIIWTIPYMPAGSGSTPGGIAFMNVYLRTLVTGTQTSNLTNKATLTNPTYTTQPTKTATTTINPSADIQINQTITGTQKYNDNETITITATNNGPNNSTGVTIKDLLPSGFQWISDNSQGTYNPTTGIWTIGTINNGNTATLTIIAKIVQTGTITNTAVLTAPLTPNFIDWNYNNNAQTISTNVNDAADIAVTQTINNTKPNTGDPITITINTTNNGPDSATGINITDLLPTGLTYTNSNTNYGTYNPTTGIWTINNLQNGNTATLTITATATNIGNYTNTATKTTETEYDWNTLNDFQSNNITICGVINSTTSFTNQGTQSGTINSDDGTTTKITLPFTITLYGQTYNTIYISVNGLISFNGPQTGPYYTVTPISSLAYLAPFWADFDVTNIGNITYSYNSSYVNITWNHVPNYTNNNSTAQLNTVSIIMTNDGRFAFEYGDLQWKNDPNDYLSIICYD